MTDPLRTDLNGFLFTPIASDANGMHLTMLSALARSGVDPWTEAAALAALSQEKATQKLVLMLAGVPGGPAPGEDTATLASNLVAQLHTAPKPRMTRIPVPSALAPSEKSPLLSFATLPARIRLTIYSVAVLFFVVMCWRALAS